MNKSSAGKKQRLRSTVIEQVHPILETLNDAVWSLDLTGGGDHYVSQSAVDLYGLHPNAESLRKGNLLQQAIHTDDNALYTTHLKRLKETGQADITCRITTKDGLPRWIFCRERLIKDDRGTPLRQEGTATDITYIKQTEEIIQEQELMLGVVFENLDMAVIITDTNGRILLCNKVAQQLSGFIGKQMKAGVDLIGFVEPSRVKVVQDIFSRVVQTRSAVQDTARYVFENQEPHYFVIHYNPVLNHQGEVTQVCIIARDISEQKKADEKLKEERNLLHISNERYRLASIATDDAIWDWDLKSGDRFWGEGFQTLFGYDLTKTKLDITSWREHIHPEDLDRVMKNMDEVINAPAAQKWEDEYRYRQADGSFANVVDRGFIIRDDDNRPVRMIGAMQDTSERTATLEKIRKLSLVASKTDNAVIIINEAFEAEWVNESFTRLTGYSPEEIVNKKLDQILQGPESDLYLIDRIHQRLLRGESVSEEILGYGKQGRKFWLRMNITPIFNDEGVIDKYISIQTDITAQKEYERGITAMARELGNLIEYANAPIFGFDKQGYIDEWNNVCFTITGYAKSEVYGKKIINLMVADEHRNNVMDILKSVLQGESISNYELPIITRDQKSVIILLNATPRWNSQGQIVGALAIGLDVTELTEYRRSLEEKVQERTRELKEAVKKEKELADMKNRFVSIASHEFRTPLSTISFSAGFIRKYKHKISAEEFDKKLAGIDKQVQHMTFLLDDILTLGKSDAGAIQVKSSKLNIRSFLEKTIEEVRNAHQNSHRIDFNVTIPVKAEEIETDEKLLRNVFVNLLSNAIKFSPGKESVAVRGDMEGNYVVLQVKDSGIGIPEEDVKNIFEPFHRGNNAAAIQGTGLGLSIVKKAVDLLKGKIEVASEPGCGTTFTVKIPAENG